MSDEEHSIRAEPHLRPTRAQSRTASEEPALGAHGEEATEEDTAQHNVWDEPWAQRAGLSVPKDRINYASWYRDRLESVSPLFAWSVCVFLAVVGGIWAIAGTFVSASVASIFPILSVVVIGPSIEEVMKITAVAVVLERRPYLFPHALVLVAAVAASALTFAVVENLLYIRVYVDEPTPAFVRWRWTVCTAMHVGATLIAGLGLRRMWQNSRKAFTKPVMADAFPYIVAAAVFHGGYNLFAFLYEGVFRPF